MADTIKGSCLCGSVAFEITGKTGPIGQCHCSKCRKVSGTDGNAVFHTAFDSLHWISGEDRIQRYVVSEDGEWTTAFCRQCGSPVPNPNAEKKIYFVQAGLLDTDIEHSGYAAHIFVGSKASWVRITDEAPQFLEGFDSEQIA